MTNNEN